MRKQVYLTTGNLRAMVDIARRAKFSNGPNAYVLRNLDPHGRHQVVWWMVHQPCREFWNESAPGFPWDFSYGGGKIIRAVVAVHLRNRKPVEILCDFDHDDFMRRIDGTKAFDGQNRFSVI